MTSGVNFVQSIIFFLLPCALVKGYPMKTENEVQPDEKVFPNGTVVGKYAYVDQDGNPIQVKYYADDSSYGVELNSIRVLQNKDSDAGPISTNLQEILDKQAKKQNDPTATVFDFTDSIKFPLNAKADKFNRPPPNPLDTIAKDSSKKKTAHLKSKYKNPDYDVFMKSDFNTPNQQCETDNEKFRIYSFNKDARIVREAPQEAEQAEFCDVF